jgi:hypothetical protein
MSLLPARRVVHFVAILASGPATLAATCFAATQVDNVAAARVTHERHDSHDSHGTHWWRRERARREAVLQQYLQRNAQDWASFRNAPLAFNGIPVIMIKVLPVLFPEIWGDEFLAKTGLPRDAFEPGRTLPLGLGGAPTIPLTPTFKMQTATVTCATCHVGRVRTSTGSVKPLIGAPNTTFAGFRELVERSASIAPDPAKPARPSWSVASFRGAMQQVVADPKRGWAWFYGSDPESLTRAQIEVGAFLTNDPLATGLVTQVQQRVLGMRQLIDATLGTYTYGQWAKNPPDLHALTPGFMDVLPFGTINIMVSRGYDAPTIIAALPPRPAMADILSVWRQSDRVMGQWDGSIRSPLHRNLGAELAVASSVALVNVENAGRTTAFTQQLPPTPYPFDVDEAAATRGRQLYRQHCAACHAVGSDRIFTNSGTDPNRARLWTDLAMSALRDQAREACVSTDPRCHVADEDIVRRTLGYPAPPLDGLWARAPYLHNGSVPTLEHLLSGRRPKRFYRGNVAYDEKRLGFVYDDATVGVLFDTSKDGLSNAGHDTADFNGRIEWKGRRLSDLIEYLKTL